MKHPSFVRIVIAGVIALAVGSNAQAGLMLDGREWYQPVDVVGYSWDDLFAVCGSGPCSGRVGGFGPDLTGWTWASVYDVGSLFQATTPHPGGIATYIDNTPEDNGPAWANDLISSSGSDGFIPTIDNIQFPVLELGVVGLTASRAGATGNPYLGSVGLFGYPSPTRPFEIEIDGAVGTLLSSFGTSYQTTDYGAWLYRTEVVNVGTPSTWLLLLAALAGLGRAHNRQRRN